MVATRYYDEELLVHLGLLDDLQWLFVQGSMVHFAKMKKHTYRNLTLKFLSNLHVEVTRGPHCQAT